MGWLDAQLFRRAAAMRYGGASDAEPYTDPGKDHWRKVVVSCSHSPCLILLLPKKNSLGQYSNFHFLKSGGL